MEFYCDDRAARLLKRGKTILAFGNYSNKCERLLSSNLFMKKLRGKDVGKSFREFSWLVDSLFDVFDCSIFIRGRKMDTVGPA